MATPQTLLPGHCCTLLYQNFRVTVKPLDPSCTSRVHIGAHLACASAMAAVQSCYTITVVTCVVFMACQRCPHQLLIKFSVIRLSVGAAGAAQVRSVIAACKNKLIPNLHRPGCAL